MIVNTYNKNKHEIAESHPINEEIKSRRRKHMLISPFPYSARPKYIFHDYTT